MLNISGLWITPEVLGITSSSMFGAYSWLCGWGSLMALCLGFTVSYVPELEQCKKPQVGLTTSWTSKGKWGLMKGEGSWAETQR